MQHTIPLFSTSSPLVLFTLFQLTAGKRLWALRKMGLSPFQLRKGADMPFGLMLGVGKGFGLDPDWDRYALLTSWRSPEAAHTFLQQATLVQQLQARSRESWSVLMQPVLARGEWGGKNPFLPLAEPLAAHEPVVVLTRATIRPSRMVEFWRQVAPVSGATEQAPGLLAKVGIGELPVVQQATLSVWENLERLEHFAYHMQQHRAVIGQTRRRNWYSEELFARFRPLWTQGRWEGQEVLPGLSTAFL
jgi:heme-degrading monooxygenase HmoA